MTSVKKPSSGDRRMVKQINETPPTPEQMSAFMQACGELPEGSRSFEAHSITWAQLYPGDLDQAVSAQFRLMALARLVTEGPLPGWTKPESDGSFLVREAMARAVALEPVVLRRGQIVFDRKAFLRRLFSLGVKGTV